VKDAKRYTVFDFAKMTKTEVLDYRGTQELPARPQILACDFCERPSDRLWCRRVAPFSAEMWSGREMVFTGGFWNACVFCNPVVEVKDIAALVARVTIVSPSWTAIPPTDAAKGLERLYVVVFKGMAEASVEWHAGDVFPVGDVP
jgi:hypothetical protein